MKSNTPTSSIGYGRYLNLPTATTIGAMITVGLGVFLLIGPIANNMGLQTATAYMIGLLFFLPIVFTIAERAAASGTEGTFFHLALNSGSIRRSYIIGWSLFGGLIALGALLAKGGAFYLSTAFETYFATAVPSNWLALALLLPVLLNQWPGSQISWQRRAKILFAGVLFVTFLITWAEINPPESIQGYAYIPDLGIFVALPFLATSLWGLYFILEQRQYVRGSQSRILRPLLATMILGSSLGAFVAVFLQQYPSLIAGNITPLASLAATFHPAWELLLIIIVLMVAMMAIDQTLSSALRLAKELATQGFLNLRYVAPDHINQTPKRLLLLLTVAIAGLILLLQLDALAGTASVTFLVAIGLLHLPYSLQNFDNLPKDRPLRLPLQPLPSITTVIICFVMILMLNLTQQLPAIIWLAVGAIYYFLYARRTAISVRQQTVITSVKPTTGLKTGHRLLVAVSNPDTAVALIRAGAVIAKTRKATLFVLQVIAVTDQITTAEHQEQAQETWQTVTEWITAARTTAVAITPLIRIASTVIDGLTSTIWEAEIDTVLLGWPTRDTPPLIEQANVVDQLVRTVPGEVLVHHGKWPATISNALVSMTSNLHGAAALTLGQELATDTVTAFKPMPRRVTAEQKAQYSNDLQETIAQNDKHLIPVKIDLVRTSDSQATIINAAKSADLTIVGISDEGFLAPTSFSGLPVAIAENSPQPTILVKRNEPAARFWLRRGWEQTAGILPNITGKQQRVVTTGMRQNAKANIDYYVLIILSTSLALLGLLQNSTAVIIGAMLVAPLMSPILAIAYGIVRGNVRMIRQAANSTLNGIVLAIALPTFISLFLIALGQGRIPPATSQILARTQPGLLDLFVALISGLAAAYAVGRAQVAAALPGVAIAAALVPPLAVVGYGLGTAQLDFAAGAFLLFVTNLAAIVLASTLMFLLLGVRPQLSSESGQQTKHALRWAAIALGAVTIPLIVLTIITIRQSATISTVETVMESYSQPGEVIIEDLQVQSKPREVTVSFTVYDNGGSISAKEMENLQNSLSAAVGRPVTMNYLIVPSSIGTIDDQTTVPTPLPSPEPIVATAVATSESTPEPTPETISP